MPLVRLTTLAACLVALLVTGRAEPLHGQIIGPATENVTWSASAAPARVAPGDTVVVRVESEIGPGWKMYALDSPRPSRGVELAFTPPTGFVAAGPILQSEPKEHFDPNFGVDVRTFEDEAAFSAAFAVSSEAAPGSHVITGTVLFQICNDRLCLPPTRAPLEAPVQVVAASASVPPSPASATTAPDDEGKTGAAPDLTEGRAPLTAPGERDAEEAERPAVSTTSVTSSDLDAARSGGLWGFLVLAVGAGLAALLTPCVFPMIPLTVSYFTNHAGSRSASVRMALVYGLAIVVTFTALGALTAALVGAAGAQTIAANPWINLFIGAVFVLFALSLLGLFELRLPSGLLNYFNRQSHEHGGLLGVLFMAVTLTLVSFSCTAPFVGGLLAATVNDEWAYPLLGMVAFSATFSLPFVLFALFPQGLSSLPRSGAWMNTVKVVLGFVELAAALKFLSNADLIWGWGLLSRPLAIALTIVIFLLAGLYLIGQLPLAHEESPRRVGVPALLLAVLFFGVALYMLPGLFGAPLNRLDAYLPPRQMGDVSLVTALPGRAAPAAEQYAWHEERTTAFAEARATGKPVFIDFTGYTCTNCRQMEANVFPQPEVARRLENDFVLLRLYTDDAEKGPALQRYQLETTGTVALPTYAILDPGGEELLARHTGIATTDEFVRFLDAGRQALQDGSLAVR